MARPRQPRKPFHPWGDIQRALLRILENVVVSRALLSNLRRHAVKALRSFFQTAPKPCRRRHGRCGPLPSSKGWMVTNQKMRQPCFKHRINIWICVETIPKIPAFRRRAVSPGVPDNGRAPCLPGRRQPPSEPVLSSRQAPALIFVMPLRPVGNRGRMPRKEPFSSE